jgi:hypothetical protein
MLSEVYVALRVKFSEMLSEVYVALRVKHPDGILVRFEWNLKVLDTFSKNTLISNFMEVRLVAAELLCADFRTDRRDENNGQFLAIL